MSATLAQTRANVYEMLGDLNSDLRSIGVFRLNQAIEKHSQLVAGRTIRPRETISSVALVANTYDYSLSAEIMGVHQVFLNSNGFELGYLPFTDFNAFYRQETASPVGGTPMQYTVWEGTNGALRIRVGPTPAAADTLKVHNGIVPVALSADSTSIFCTRELLRAIECFAAAECVMLLSEDELAKLKTTRGYAAVLMDQAEQGIKSDVDALERSFKKTIIW